MSSHPLFAGPRPSFWQALSIQMRVVGALILRELHTRYGRDNVGYLWLFGEPMMLASVIGLIHGASGHANYGSDVLPVQFGVSGYTLFILFRGVVNRSEGTLEANQALLYHRQVTIFDVVISRALLELSGVFMTYVLLTILITMLGYGAPPARLLPFLASWFLMFWYCLGHAFLITSLSYHNHTVARFVHPYSYFMIPLSGSFTPMTWMSPHLRELLSYIPLTSIFELMRYGQFESYDLKYVYPQYVIGFCFILTWVGLVQMRALRHRIHLS
jgi:capsular polysaccharide transport system permease protein